MFKYRMVFKHIYIYMYIVHLFTQYVSQPCTIITTADEQVILKYGQDGVAQGGGFATQYFNSGMKQVTESFVEALRGQGDFCRVFSPITKRFITTSTTTFVDDIAARTADWKCEDIPCKAQQISEAMDVSLEIAKLVQNKNKGQHV